MRQPSPDVKGGFRPRRGGVTLLVTLAALAAPALTSAAAQPHARAHAESHRSARPAKPHGSVHTTKPHAAATSFTAVLHAPNHTPVENKKWWIRVNVTRGKQKLSGSVYYRFLFAGTVVSHQPGHKFKNGLYKDALVFPAAAVGKPLTLQVVVSTKYGTKYLSWNVKPVA